MIAFPLRCTLFYTLRVPRRRSMGKIIRTSLFPVTLPGLQASAVPAEENAQLIAFQRRLQLRDRSASAPEVLVLKGREKKKNV